ncbi:MAG: ABC transporter ATP-binding protein [Clostridia bacterium]|nr:ABC transporter ATP-binding protein [Clostridia bacterium]
MILENKKYSIMDVIRIAFRCDAVFSSLIALKVIISGLVPTLQIIVTANFVDMAIRIVNDKLPINNIYPSIIFIVLLIGFQWLSDDLNKLSIIRFEMTLKEKFRTAITEKRSQLDYKHIENHEAWDLISRVSKNPENTISRAYRNLLDILSLFLKIGGILLVLITQVWWVALVIVAVSVPLFYLAVKSGKANYEANREATKYKRKHEYLTKVLTEREAVNERELFGFTNKLNEAWSFQYNAARTIEVKTKKKWFIKMKTGSLITASISIIIIFILLNPVINGIISVGMFISLVDAVFNMVQMMSWQLTSNFDQLATHKEYMNDLSAFSALSGSVKAGEPPSTTNMEFETLEFINVKFKYPGTDFYVLNGLSFKIEKGRHFAFVGINGAGKTTITKLITGLYDEFEGEILINGTSISSYDKAELKSFYSVVYQDFAKYSISVRDNIAIGNVNQMGNAVIEENIKVIISELDLKDAINKFPDGLNTFLGKIKKDGMDISGGEWQRLAMARAIISEAPFRILDEPTAALDPISESRLYEQFENISKEKTTLFISHRLGSTKLADIIFVLSNGSIAESGTHDELMDNDGIYKEMYQSQRSWYK